MKRGGKHRDTEGIEKRAAEFAEIETPEALMGEGNGEGVSPSPAE